MIGGKLNLCRRGHDVSYPEARDSGRHCKKCKQVTRNIDYDFLYEISYSRQKSRYSQYKKRLRDRIELKRERLPDYAQEK